LSDARRSKSANRGANKGEGHERDLVERLLRAEQAEPDRRIRKGVLVDRHAVAQVNEWEDAAASAHN
jgi:hypothetical protein